MRNITTMLLLFSVMLNKIWFSCNILQAPLGVCLPTEIMPQIDFRLQGWKGISWGKLLAYYGWQQAVTWTNIDLSSSIKSSDNQLSTVSQEEPQPQITKNRLKINFRFKAVYWKTSVKHSTLMRLKPMGVYLPHYFLDSNLCWKSWLIDVHWNNKTWARSTIYDW